MTQGLALHVPLLDAVTEKTAAIGVIGLGYVGLTTATLIADAGFKVIGADVAPLRVDDVNCGHWPLETDEPHMPDLMKRAVDSGRLRASSALPARSCNVVIIAVPTPVASKGVASAVRFSPDLSYLTSALFAANRAVKPAGKGGAALIIIESTVAPGTTEWAMDQSAGFIEQYHVPLLFAACPERVTAGRLFDNSMEIQRLVGGLTREAAKIAMRLYESIGCRAIGMTAREAEIAKCLENAYRDVQIAFANEAAVICQEQGVSFAIVRQAVNSCPGREVLDAGPGVGGHCLPKDGWLLAHAVGEERCRLILKAREVNTSMAAYVAKMAWDAMDWSEVPTVGRRVALLGRTYRPDVRDKRNAAVWPVANELVRLGVSAERIQTHDPFTGPTSLRGTLCGSDCAILLVGHTEYANLDWLDWADVGAEMRHKIVIDTQYCCDVPNGFTLLSLGEGDEL